MAKGDISFSFPFSFHDSLSIPGEPASPTNKAEVVQADGEWYRWAIQQPDAALLLMEMTMSATWRQRRGKVPIEQVAEWEYAMYQQVDRLYHQGEWEILGRRWLDFLPLYYDITEVPLGHHTHRDGEPPYPVFSSDNHPGRPLQWRERKEREAWRNWARAQPDSNLLSSEYYAYKHWFENKFKREMGPHMGRFNTQKPLEEFIEAYGKPVEYRDDPELLQKFHKSCSDLRDYAQRLRDQGQGDLVTTYWAYLDEPQSS